MRVGDAVLAVDGAALATLRTAPYGFDWDTTALAGSTRVTPVAGSTLTATTILSPLAGETDSTRAARSRRPGKTRVSKAHQV